MSSSFTLATRIATVLAITLLISGNCQALQSVAEPDPGLANPNAKAISELQRIIEHSKIEKVKWEGFLEESLRLKDQIEDKRKELLRKQDEIGISSESFAEIMRTLQSQRVELMIDLAGLEARKEVLQNGNSADVKTELDEERIALMKEMVDLKTVSLARKKSLYEKGSLDQESYMKAQSEALMAKIDLAESQRPVQENGSSAFALQLMDVSLERAEKTARLEKIESLLRIFSSERETIREIDKLEIQYDASIESINSNKNKVHSLDEQIKANSASLESLLNPPRADR